MTRARTGLVLLAVALALALAGCQVGPTSPGSPSVPDGEDAAAAYDDLGNVTGDLQVNVTSGDRTNRSTLRFTAEVGTRNVRQRVLEPDSHRGNAFVSNDAYYWRYNDSRDVAARYAHTAETFESTFGAGEDDFGAFLEAAFDAANESEGTVSDLPEVGVGPAPTVAAGEDATPVRSPTANVSEFVVSYEGTTTVRGERTHVLAVEPANPDAAAASNLTVTYYVDRERFFPVRVERTATIDGDPWSHVMTFSNLTYDANVSAETYEYEPEESTNVVDYATGVVRFPTPEALAANTSVPVPEPTVPEGFEFAYAAGIDLNVTGGQVLYANESTVLVAGRYVDDGIVQPREREGAENTTVDGHRALYVDLGRTKAVYVYCEDYVVSGAAIGQYPRDELVAFTASLACGDDAGDGASGDESSGTREDGIATRGDVAATRGDVAATRGDATATTVQGRR
jgi:outer membrane lipoprotein-sorting protein